MMNCLPKYFGPVIHDSFSFRADNLRVHMKIHGDPQLLSLPMEKLLAPGYEESMEESLKNTQVLSASRAASTSHGEPSQAKNSQHHVRHQEEKTTKVDPKTGNLSNIVDSVLDMSQSQVANLHSVAAHQNANGMPQQGGSGAHTLPAPTTGYQLVAGGAGEAAYIPAAAIQSAHDQSRYANMETISASAMMLMTTNYFQPLGNSQQ